MRQEQDSQPGKPPEECSAGQARSRAPEPEVAYTRQRDRYAGRSPDAVRGKVTLRARALGLLARREYSRAELARKLVAHAESEEVLAGLLDDLEARCLLSDARYAEMRLNARSARYGNARLSQELHAHGVDAALIDTVLSGCGDEVARAQQVWQRKFGAQPPAQDVAGRAKQVRFLMRRGFSGETIRRILRVKPNDEE